MFIVFTKIIFDTGDIIACPSPGRPGIPKVIQRSLSLSISADSLQSSRLSKFTISALHSDIIIKVPLISVLIAQLTLQQSSPIARTHQWFFGYESNK